MRNTTESAARSGREKTVIATRRDTKSGNIGSVAIAGPATSRTRTSYAGDDGDLSLQCLAAGLGAGHGLGPPGAWLPLRPGPLASSLARLDPCHTGTEGMR